MNYRVKRSFPFPGTLLFAILPLLVGLNTQGRAQVIRIYSGNSGFLGVQVRDIKTEDVSSLKLPKEEGVYIEDVSSDGPAAKAGLKEKDVITRFSGIPVISVRQFTRLVADTPPGRTVTVEIIRDGRQSTLSVTLAKRSAPEYSWNFRHPGPPLPVVPPEFNLDIVPRDHNFFVFSERPRLGISGGALTDQLAEFLGVSGGKGVLIMEVLSGTPAEKAGLKAGDVITRIDTHPVESLEELSRHLSAGRHQLHIVRDKKAQSVSVDIGSPKKAGAKKMKL